ncbi:uncharacterized protein LOC135940042 [Cloeon dipterum]|uniref:uncharacterized protein LOC135940042 n=1 Tax=Cloeon dipterum TaxID=197152 RepID=UPI00322048BC
MSEDKVGLNQIAKETLKTIVTLRENHAMNLGGIEVLTECVNNVLQSFISQLEEKMRKIDQDLAGEFAWAAKQMLLEDPVKPVSTEHRVMSCLRLYCGLIEPVPVKQGIGFLPTYGDGNESLGVHDIKAVYIPIEKQITELLQYREVRELVLNSKNYISDENIIRSVYDGKVVKNHPIVQKYKNENCLLLQIYEDDVELCNPLGSYSKTHKVTLVYWTLLNLPEHVRSNLKSINLQGVATADSIKYFGFEALLSDFIDFIKKLEAPEGVKIVVEGLDEPLILHGTLVSLNGDGLALNSIGGFKGIGFALKPCRNCDISKEDIGKVFFEVFPRDLKSHRERVDKLCSENLTGEQRTEISKLYGINGRSVLADLENFDLTTCLPQDLMHNLLEGVAEVELRALIFELIEERSLLTYNDLNYLVSGFPFPKEFLRSKPSPFEPAHIKNGKLRQNASQMLCLIYIVPFMLEDFAKSETLPYIENFSLLGKITNVLLAYEVKKSDLNLSRFMINCHHSRYCDLYPKFPPTPKFHFLVHAPSVIEQLGPVRVSWNMRYEAMNAWASKVGEQTRNFINIPKTIATRFQTKRCLDFNFGDKSSTILGEKTFMPVGEQLADLNLYILGAEVAAELNCSSEFSNGVHTVKKLFLNNFEIQADSNLLINDTEETLPRFGKVKAIFVKSKESAFVFQLYSTEGYNYSTNAYEVTLTNKFSCKNVKKIPFFNPLPQIQLRRKTNIILQFHSRNEFVG